MKLYCTKTAFFVEEDSKFYHLKSHFLWDQLINRDDLYDFLQNEIKSLTPVSKFDDKDLLPPIGTQEVWAAGVTYFRSRVARMEESKDAGGGTFYDKVYSAERPELFFKSTARKVVGPHQSVGIRPDSSWDVPEPEWTLYATSSGKIVAYTIGNDMSSRSIEGENPLYLPQAKVYNGSAALGPCLYVPAQPMPMTSSIQIEISRNNEVQYKGETTLEQLKRKPDELMSWLFRYNTFSEGVFLMTGTGLVPENSFTLQEGDAVKITIEHIGTLENTVKKAI
jgi:2-dehydro-3-deoxy-D-arabinonate dehydratase